MSNGKTLHYHSVPSGLGLTNSRCVNLIGSGTVLHVGSFFAELAELQQHGVDTTDRLFISDRTHVVLDLHQLVDGLEEVELGNGSLGTTKKGIGPTYSSKMARSGIRMSDVFDAALFESKLRRLAHGYAKRYGDLLHYDADAEIEKFKDYRDRLRALVIDQVPLLQSAKKQGLSILVEGANAVMLDIGMSRHACVRSVGRRALLMFGAALDSGSYPFVTSSSTGLGGVLNGLTLGWRSIKEVIGVVCVDACFAYLA